MSESDLAQFEQQMAEVIADLDLYSYYQLLGVEPTASKDVINYNFNLKVYEYEQVKKRKDCSSTLYHTLTLLTDRLNEAHQVLTNSEHREEYDRDIEKGATRHRSIIIERKRPEDMKGVGADDAHVERAVRHLEDQLGAEMLDAGEEADEGVVEEVDRLQLAQLTEAMAAKLARAGVEFKVRDDWGELDDMSAIDPEFLQDAVEGLQTKLDKLGVDTDDEGEVDDVSADADYAADLVAELQEELAAMGLDMFDVAEVVDFAPEEEMLDAEGNPIVRPKFDPLEATALKVEQEVVIEIAEELKIDADRLLDGEDDKRIEDQARQEWFGEVIDLSHEPPGPPPRHRNQKSVAKPPPYNDDAIPLIVFDAEDN